MSLDLINKALQYAKEARTDLTNQPNWVNEPLFPEARRSILYLRVRQNIFRGCRKSVKIIPENWKRSIAYSILVRACFDIFHYGPDPNLFTHYNGMLDQTIGTH